MAEGSGGTITWSLENNCCDARLSVPEDEPHQLS